MNAKNLILNGAALLALGFVPAGAPAAFAQSQAPAPNTPAASSSPNQPAKPTVNQRKENQQDRIAQGVQSGQLTAGETKNLENKEAGLNKEERTMRSEDNGHLTSADRTKLNRQQNRLSQNVYRDKHNAAQAHYGNSRFGQRRENQQDRIAQGIKNGKLSPRETSRLENQQQGMNREAAGMRQANGGKLSASDRRQLNRQQNQSSRKIYRTKHDGRGR